MTDPVDPAEAALKTAHALLDERPREAVRREILRRAAAEMIPGAAAPSAATIAPASRRSRSPWRIPATAFATAAIAAIAVGIAVQTRDSQLPPPVVAPESPAASGSAPAAAPVPVPGPPAKAAAAPEAMARKERLESDAPSAPVQNAERPDSGRVQEALKKSDAREALERRSAAAVGSAAAPEPPSPWMPASAGLAAKPVPPPAAGASSRDEAGPPARAQFAAPAPAAQVLPAVQDKALAEAAAPAYRSDPVTWMRRVIELRRMHRDAEAEEELVRFRAAHPEIAVPQEAQRILAPVPSSP